MKVNTINGSIVETPDKGLVWLNPNNGISLTNDAVDYIERAIERETSDKDYADTLFEHFEIAIKVWCVCRELLPKSIKEQVYKTICRIDKLAREE